VSALTDSRAASSSGMLTLKVLFSASASFF
jgi:hypothetical protein